MSKIAEKVLKVARDEIGTAEKPKNSNNVKYNTWYYGQEVWDGKNRNKYPWCMAFVQWCYMTAQHPLPYKTASCSSLLNWYKKNKPELVHTTEPQPGDIVIYKGHTGIFEKLGPDPKYMYVIEGNTAVGNDDNGGCVMQRYRKVSSAIAFITPFEAEKEEDEDDEMIDIDEFVRTMTDKQAYDIIIKAQAYAATLPMPGWAVSAVNRAISHGVTDGTRPMALIPRYQAAIMADRAYEANIKEKNV